MPDTQIPEQDHVSDDTKPDDMTPVQVVRPGRRSGLVSLLNVSSLILTLVAGVLYVTQSQNAKPTPAPTEIVVVPNEAPATIAPTIIPTVIKATAIRVVETSIVEPDPAVIASLMAQPPNNTPPETTLYRQQTAFTIAPARPRAAPVQYKIRVGDTVEKIAQRFNITQDSLIWNNDITYINRLTAGTTLRIPPVNGILYKPTADETIQQMADKFKVSPYAIIDSEYNRLQSALPETLIPANQLEVMIPGGVSTKKAIFWKPQIDTRPAAGRGVGQVRFGGGAGSCGFVSNGGGDGSLGIPLGGYTVRGTFGTAHGGLDLAASTGTTIVAAGGGTVIFAGWSEWGYGNTVVIAHTPTLWTLYAHMSRISVSCGQFVNRGTAIGAVGSTGNSTGPHLHFETRVGGDPVNPIQFLGGI
jgi:murein DD-endopeptidase MepM/ murein hydrolase activator NlpD